MSPYDALEPPSASSNQIQPMGFLYEASLIAQEQENVAPIQQAENAQRHADLLAQLEERACL